MSKANLFTHGEWVPFVGQDKSPTTVAVFLNGNNKTPIVDWMGFDHCHKKISNTENKANVNLIATAGTTATKLSEMGFDAVKLIEALPSIMESIEDEANHKNPHSIEDCHSEITGIIDNLKVKQCQK